MNLKYEIRSMKYETEIFNFQFSIFNHFAKWFLIGVVTFLSSTTFAGDLDKVFKYLNSGDYNNAKKYLLEVVAESRL